MAIQNKLQNPDRFNEHAYCLPLQLSMHKKTMALDLFAHQTSLLQEPVNTFTLLDYLHQLFVDIYVGITA